MRVVVGSNYGRTKWQLWKWTHKKTERSKVSLSVTAVADLHLAAKGKQKRTPCWSELFKARCTWLNSALQHEVKMWIEKQARLLKLSVTSQFPVHNVKQHTQCKNRRPPYTTCYHDMIEVPNLGHMVTPEQVKFAEQYRLKSLEKDSKRNFSLEYFSLDMFAR